MASDQFSVNITWVVNAARNENENFNVKVKEAFTVRQLKRKIQTFVGRHSSIHIVVKGKVLSDPEILRDVGILKDDPTSHRIFITVTQRRRDSENRANQEPEQPAPAEVIPPVHNAPQDSNISQSSEVTNLLRQHFKTLGESKPSDVAQLIQSFLTFKAKETPPAESTSEAPADQQEEEHEKMCRICFDDAEDESTGKLITPCRCRGSMRYIHLNCLNRWREMSPGNKNYIQCPQCLYKYNTQRKDWADYIDNPRTIQFITIIIMLFGIVLSGIVYTSIGYQDVIYEKLEWFPKFYWAHKNCYYQTAENKPSYEHPHEYCNKNCNSWFESCSYQCHPICEVEDTFDFIIDVLFGGGLILGVVGLYIKRDDLSWMHLLMLLAANGGRMFRFFYIAGVAYSFQAVFTRVSIKAAHIVTKFGEIIMEFGVAS